MSYIAIVQDLIVFSAGELFWLCGLNYLCRFVQSSYARLSTISLDDFKNLWQIFEKLIFSKNDYDVALSLLDNVNAHNDGNLHIIKINYL